jgi:hypothetical protein
MQLGRMYNMAKSPFTPLFLNNYTPMHSKIGAKWDVQLRQTNAWNDTLI